LVFPGSIFGVLSYSQGVGISGSIFGVLYRERLSCWLSSWFINCFFNFLGTKLLIPTFSQDTAPTTYYTLSAALIT
jgi:hypothetical protein